MSNSLLSKVVLEKDQFGFSFNASLSNSSYCFFIGTNAESIANSKVPIFETACFHVTDKQVEDKKRLLIFVCQSASPSGSFSSKAGFYEFTYPLDGVFLQKDEEYIPKKLLIGYTLSGSMHCGKHFENLYLEAKSIENDFYIFTTLEKRIGEGRKYRLTTVENLIKYEVGEITITQLIRRSKSCKPKV